MEQIQNTIQITVFNSNVTLEVVDEPYSNKAENKIKTDLRDPRIFR